MASRLKPTNARRLVPIFDNVKLKARFVISIAHPIGMVALSNTRKIYNASLYEKKKIILINLFLI